MSEISNETIKSHLRVLYSGHRDLLKSLDRMARSLETVLTTLEDSKVTIPAPVRKSLKALAESLGDAQVSAHTLEAVEENVTLLAPEPMKWEAK
jgi:hypothetical protein